MFPSDYSNLIEEARKQKYKCLKWSKHESLFKITKPLHRSPHSITEKITTSLVLDIRLRLSCFGIFMKSFNEKQLHNFFLNENNLGIEKCNYKNIEEKEQQRWNINNEFTDNTQGLLKKAVLMKNVIDYDFFYENLRTLRLTNGPINTVDSLTKFNKLEVLVLASNWIKQVKRKYLPPDLLYLECFDNQIKNVKCLCTKGGPQRMKYLGLARNLLDETSCLHLLANSKTFKQLRALDIANNDFVSLVRLLEELSPLQQLTALTLEGNPCYVCEGYQLIVLDFFPKLRYLDGTEILKEDRPQGDNMFIQNLATTATFHFTCYRIVGLPPPPKSKATHSYYLEIDLPLMEPIKIPQVIAMESKSTDTFDFGSLMKIKSEFTKSSTDAKGSKKAVKAAPKKDQKETKVKAVDGSGLYALPNEVEAVENNYLAFRTEEKSWSKMIKFQKPTITIDVPYNNFSILRDTFKSRVRIKLMYAQRFLNKPKKLKVTTMDTASKTTFSSSKLHNNPDEVTLKRSTLLTFYCDLQPVNWSDHSVDFLWADHPHFGDTAILVNGTLKPEIYDEKLTGPSKKPSERKIVTPASSKNPMPKTVTCNVGFALQRYTQEEEN